MFNPDDIEKVFVFDIETITDPDLNEIKLLEEFKNKHDKSKNLGGKLVDAAKIEAKALLEIEKLPLDIFKNRMISASWSTFKIDPSEPSGIKINTFVIFSHSEAEVAQALYDAETKHFIENGKIIYSGFNITGFDIPQVRAKIAKNKITKSNKLIENILPTGKYDMRIDLFDILGNKGSLVKWLKYFGIQPKYNGYNGGDVARLYKEGKYDEIKKYSYVDAKVEALLFLKLMGY